MPDDLQELIREREQIDEAIAGHVAARDKIENDLDEQRQRDPEQQRIKAKVERKIDTLNERRKRQNKRIRALRAERGEVSKEIKEEKAEAPRFVDLNLSFRSGMATQTALQGIIFHYTAGPTDDDLDDAIALCRQYHGAHLANGWAGEGYALCFTRDGSIIGLRPPRYVGAHTLNKNTGQLGIMAHGTTGDTWTEPQLRTYRWWLENGHTDKVPAEFRIPVKPGSLPVTGHNDWMATGCPGSFKEKAKSKGK